MNTDDVLDVFREAGALLEGHFILSSGRRSPVFLQKALIFKNPRLTEIVCKALAEKVKAAGIVPDVIIAPAMGGVIPGYENIGVPLVSLAARRFPDYDPNDLPPELVDLPATKPGSRGLS